VGYECDFLTYVEDESDPSSKVLKEPLERYEEQYHPREAADFVFVWELDR